MSESKRFKADMWVPHTQIEVANSDGPRRSLFAKLYRILQLLGEDLRLVRPRLHLVNGLVRLMPRRLLGWLRPWIYQLAGVRVGRRARIFGPLELTGEGQIAGNVSIGDDCLFTTPLFLNASAPITIGNRVTIGHHVLIITDTHEYDDPRHRCGAGFARPVTIEDGVWIAANVTILPGVTIGEGSVVAAGAVVTRDVRRHTMVGGAPARVVKKLAGPSAARKLEAVKVGGLEKQAAADGRIAIAEISRIEPVGAGAPLFVE